MRYSGSSPRSSLSMEGSASSLSWVSSAFRISAQGERTSQGPSSNDGSTASGMMGGSTMPASPGAGTACAPSGSGGRRPMNSSQSAYTSAIVDLRVVLSKLKRE